ncbi:MAG: hypothetical protein AB8I08_16790 [Sandaracinaceae bacterium]
MSAPITASVADRRGDGMVVRQPLPFLSLDTHVTDDDGQRARISHVRIAMHDGVPSIELELENLCDETLAAEPAFVPGESQRPPRGDETLPYGGAQLASREVVVGPVISAETMPAREPTLTGIGRPSMSDALADTIPALRPVGSLPPQTPVRRESFVARLIAAMRGFVSALFGRPALALPRP